jgi:hypothetical protein
MFQFKLLSSVLISLFFISAVYSQNTNSNTGKPLTETEKSTQTTNDKKAKSGINKYIIKPKHIKIPKVSLPGKLKKKKNVTNVEAQSKTNVKPKKKQGKVAKFFKRMKEKKKKPKKIHKVQWWKVSLGYYNSPEGTGYTYRFFDKTYIDFRNWIKFVWMPVLHFKYFKSQFYFPFYLSFPQIVKDGKLSRVASTLYNTEDYDWKDPHLDYLNTIVYFKFPIKNHYFTFGKLPKQYYGSGFLLNSYVNSLLHPNVRKHGILWEYDNDIYGIGFNSFLNDIVSPNLIATCFTVRPFWKKHKDSRLLVKTMELSHNLVASPNSTPSGSDVYGNSFELIVPITEKTDRFSLNSYANTGFLAANVEQEDKNFGRFYGPGFSLGWLAQALFFKFKIEGYLNVNGFQPKYFDYMYYFWELREAKFNSLEENRNQITSGAYLEEGLYVNKHTHWIAGFYQFWDMKQFKPAYNMFRTELKIQEDILLMYYQRKNITLKNFWDGFISPDVIMGLDIDLNIPAIIQFVVNFSLSFDENKDVVTSFHFDLIMTPAKKEKEREDKLQKGMTESQRLERQQELKNMEEEEARQKLYMDIDNKIDRME